MLIALKIAQSWRELNFCDSCVSRVYGVHQWSQTRGLRAACGPQSNFMRPATTYPKCQHLQCDTILRQKYTEIGIPDFYKFLSRHICQTQQQVDVHCTCCCWPGVKCESADVRML